MRNLLSCLLAILLACSPAWAVGTSNPPANGATATPGGSNGQIQYNNGGAFGGLASVPTVNGGTGCAGANCYYGLAAFRAQLALTKAGTANTRVCALGDSTTFGAGSNGPGNVYGGNLVANSYPTQLASFITSKYGVPAVSNGFLGAGVNGTNFGADDSRVSLGSAWFRDGSLTTFGGSAYAAGSATSSMTFTPTNNVDTFRFAYTTRANAGILSVAIDSGTPTTYNENAANSIVFVTMKAASVGSHTLKFTWSSGGYVDVAGVSEAYDSTRAWVNIVNIGSTSATSAQLSDTTAGYGNGTAAAWAALGCNFVIHSNAINDWDGGVSTTTYINNVNTTLNAVAASGASILEVTPPPTNPSGNASIATQLSYISAIYANAAAKGYPLLDWYSRWQSYANGAALGLYGDTFTHPNVYGYGDAALAIASAIMDQPTQTAIPLASSLNLEGVYSINQTTLSGYIPTLGFYSSGANLLDFAVNGVRQGEFNQGSLAIAQLVGSGSVPTIAAGAASGTSPTVSITGTNMDGVITVATGTTTAPSAVLATVTDNGTLPVAPQNCSLTPRNGNAAGQAAMVYTTAPTTTSWTISVAGAALPASTTSFQWGYHCE